MRTVLAVLLALALSATLALAAVTTVHVTRDPLFRTASVAALRMQELGAISAQLRTRTDSLALAVADSDSVEAAGIERLLNLIGAQVVKQGEQSLAFDVDRAQFTSLLAVLNSEIALYAELLETPGFTEENLDFLRGRLNAFRELAAEDNAVLSTQ